MRHIFCLLHQKLCQNISRKWGIYSVLVLAAGVYICLTKYTDLISLLSHLLYMETKLLLSKHTTRINITISLPRPFWNLSAKYLRRHFSDLQIKFHCVHQYRTDCIYVFFICASVARMYQWIMKRKACLYWRKVVLIFPLYLYLYFSLYRVHQKNVS